MKSLTSLLAYPRNWIHFRKRLFSTSPVFSTATLKDPLTNSGYFVDSSITSVDKATRITTLSNGLRVASQNSVGSHCALGGCFLFCNVYLVVIIQSGPRYEASAIKGVSHFIEKLGFHSTETYTDRNGIQEALEQCNSIFDCQISKDFIIYALSGFNKHLDQLVFILAETVLRAKITDEEMDMAKRSIWFEWQSLQMRPPVEPILNELIHSTAYGANNTLAFPRYCPEANLDVVGRRDVAKFIATYYRPERIVLAASGVDHDEFVKVVEKHFIPTVPRVVSELDSKDISDVDNSVAQYTGGFCKVERDLSQYHAPMPEFAYGALAFESCSYTDSQFTSACLLHSLLGGGGSFSAGGPGKGMYSRIYTNVLNQHYWVNSAQAENHAYTDTGLFTVIGSSSPANLHNLIQVLIYELRQTAECDISPDELNRAKNQLRSMLLMNLETRVVNFEDIARQVINTGRRREPEYWIERINSVKTADIQSFLQRMLSESVPTLVGYGQVDKLPALQDVTTLLSEPLKTKSNSFSTLLKRFI